MRPSVARLHERVRYEPSTGRLYWRNCPSHPAAWNTRYAGTEAFAADNGNGYRVGKLDGCKLLAHRVVWAMHYGDWPAEIDHEDHDRGHNLISNLRDAGHKANTRNQARRRTNTSGVNGVSWDTQRGRWLACIRVDGRSTYLGRFDDFDAAVAARKRADAAHGFHTNHGSRLD